MKKLIASTITIALLATAPASAQLLGGSGGIGGSLGGSLTGGLGSNGPETIGQAGGTLTGRGGVASSTQVDRTVDIRSGRVATDANNNSSANGSLLGGVDPMNNVANGAASGSASGSANGSSDTTLLGTDAVRSTAGQAFGTTRNTAGSARSAASGAASTGAGMARNAVAGAMGVGSLAGSAAGNGMAMGNLGQLAASGSTAANADGMFAVAPGMPIEDPKGRVIGYVQEVRQSGSGVVNSVVVESGNRTATLPAADFAGSGDVLVTGMSKGQIKQAAKQQEKTPAAETNQ
ncbi:hypothetical protein [Parasphingorhabdus sp.]|uniref:hypothetical protein n=1 Tax=Parasphingorhabdus sp. TaxID=2709688 RepID=UPI0030028E99